MPPSAGWAPSPASKRIADQRSADENGTSPATGRASPSNAARSAAVVLFGALVLAAIAATTASSAGPVSAAPIGSIAPNAIRWVVSVPVLSVRNVSIRLIASIALCRWASAPRREIRSAAAAYVTVSISARPWGTSVTSTAAAKTVSCVASPATAGSDRTTITAASPMRTATATKARAMSDWSGVRTSRWPFACERIWFAKVSAPTASTS